jgi:hypothetical protein
VILRVVTSALCLAAFCVPVLAQDEPVTINKAQIPAQADNVKKFVPRGWKIERQLNADLNGDSQADFVLKLVENKPDKDSDGNAAERARALIIVLAGDGGMLTRASVADKLLQCTRCGGAFYGVMESPADVKIEKGVIVVTQDHGSRDLTNTTYRFRYDSESQKFMLIGFDYTDADRLTGGTIIESTNYLTGARIVTREKENKKTSTRSQVSKGKIFLDDLDWEKFEEEADKRLGLN